MAKKAAMKKVLNCFVIIAILMSAIPTIAMNGDNTRNSVSNHSDSCFALSSTVIYVPDDYSTIQQAVNAANPGDTIIVRDGTYVENVDVKKPHLTIKSKNGAENCIVQAANSNDYVFEVRADYVNISGFSIVDANEGGGLSGGMHLSNVNCCNISKNDFSNNWNGIELGYSNSNKISKNCCSKNKIGICLEFSNNNIISKNICHANNWNGIALETSHNNLISDNNVLNNSYDIDLDNSTNNIITRNNCGSNNNYGLSLRDSSNNNLIFLNNFINNSGNNAYSSGSTNLWDSPSKITYTYKGRTYTNYLSNYWDDYTGSDANGDGIGDTPYSIDSDSDNYPLMDTYEIYRVGDGEKREGVIAAQITAGADDGFAARTPEYFSADSKAITIGTDLKFDAFLRFSDLKIPSNATITKAYISVVPAVTNPAGPMVHISAADVADPTAPTTSSDFYARKRTASSVNWDASSWAAGESENSTDISNVIQELVDSYDYSAGAPILIFLDIVEGGTENQYFAAFENVEYEAPKLFIEYSTGVSTGGGLKL